MKNKQQNIREGLKLTTLGFTLVELLAVIVILAIILVIAVPKVMSIISDSKKATLESIQKMQLEEVTVFFEEFYPAYEKTLDEL